MSYWDDEVDYDELDNRIKVTVNQYIQEKYTAEVLAKMVKAIDKDVAARVSQEVGHYALERLEERVREIAGPQVETAIMSVIPDILSEMAEHAKLLGETIPRKIAGKLTSKFFQVVIKEKAK